MMLAIIIYVGLFAWGMSNVPFKPLKLLGALAVALAWAGFQLFLLSRVGHIAQGIVSIVDVLIIFAIEIVACVGVFMLGYAVGRFRKRRAAAEDVADTFS